MLFVTKILIYKKHVTNLCVDVVFFYLLFCKRENKFLIGKDFFMVVSDVSISHTYICLYIFVVNSDLHLVPLGRKNTKCDISKITGQIFPNYLTHLL